MTTQHPPIFADGDQEQADRIADLIAVTTTDRAVADIVAEHDGGGDED